MPIVIEPTKNKSDFHDFYILLMIVKFELILEISKEKIIMALLRWLVFFFPLLSFISWCVVYTHNKIPYANEYPMIVIIIPKKKNNIIFFTKKEQNKI